MEDIKYIHFWKVYLPDKLLQEYIDVYKAIQSKYWLVLLAEKLRRVENEISIT